MHWRDAWPQLSELATLDWSSPERWPRAVQLASWAVAGLVSCALAWLLQDSTAELETAKRELGKAEAQHVSVERQKSEVEDMRQRLRALELAIGEGSQQYLRPDELPDLLHLLSTLSGEHRVDLGALEVKEITTLQQAGRVELQSIDLALQGAYHDIGALHQSFASLPWLVIVDAYEAEGEPLGGELLDMRVRVLLPLAISGLG